MLFLIQTISFFIAFTVIFVCVRLIPFMDLVSLTAYTNGVGWLYSAISLIFGVLAAFTVQAQSTKWDDLLRSTREEVNGLRRLFWLSYHLPISQAKRLRHAIRAYLERIIHEGWKDIDTGRRSPSLEAAIRSLQEEVFALSRRTPEYSATAIALVRSIFESREERMFQSAKRTSLLLKATIYTGAIMMIALSYFIGVPNIWIDYIFTGSIAFLVILIATVIEDLEHPYRPGHWHITQDSYRTLLEEVNKNQGQSSK
jgi:hypothetical protein